MMLQQDMDRLTRHVYIRAAIQSENNLVSEHREYPSRIIRMMLGESRSSLPEYEPADGERWRNPPQNRSCPSMSRHPRHPLLIMLYLAGHLEQGF